jgi:hypothetical protein
MKMRKSLERVGDERNLIAHFSFLLCGSARFVSVIRNMEDKLLG